MRKRKEMRKMMAMGILTIIFAIMVIVFMIMLIVKDIITEGRIDTATIIMGTAVGIAIIATYTLIELILIARD